MNVHRIGPRMREATEYVAAHPGEPKIRAATHVAPYGKGIGFGYKSVDRAIKAGLIEAYQYPSGQYALYASGQTPKEHIR